MTQRNVFNRGLGANCRQGLDDADDLGAFIFLRPITLSSYIYIIPFTHARGLLRYIGGGWQPQVKLLGSASGLARMYSGIPIGQLADEDVSRLLRLPPEKGL